MPFGLANAPATFNRLMIDLFKKELDDFVLVFFDDILVYSRHLRHVLEILRGSRLYAKKSKCTFFVDKVAYLGFIVSKNGISPNPAKVEAIVS